MNKPLMIAAGFEREVERVNAGFCPLCAKPVVMAGASSLQRREYSISLNFSTPRCRFKFYDSMASKNFYISQVAIEYMATTTRD